MPTYDLTRALLIGKLINICTIGCQLLTVKLFGVPRLAAVGYHSQSPNQDEAGHKSQLNRRSSSRETKLESLPLCHNSSDWQFVPFAPPVNVIPAG